MKKKVNVFFIGAGPGDPELITLKALKVIEKADVIIYAGSLVNKKILNYNKNLLLWEWYHAFIGPLSPAFRW